MEQIFAKKFARNYEKNNSWNISCLVKGDSSQQPSDLAYYIVDCRILWADLLYSVIVKSQQTFPYSVH